MAAASNAKTNAVALGALILEILVISRSFFGCLLACACFKTRAKVPLAGEISL